MLGLGSASCRGGSIGFCSGRGFGFFSVARSSPSLLATAPSRPGAGRSQPVVEPRHSATHTQNRRLQTSRPSRCQARRSHMLHFYQGLAATSAGKFAGARPVNTGLPCGECRRGDHRRFRCERSLLEAQVVHHDRARIEVRVRGDVELHVAVVALERILDPAGDGELDRDELALR